MIYLAAGLIRKFRVRNFKSLADVELELGKVNIVVGPNGAGKGNLVDAFMLL
ncbi:AAA family ATPase, partial [Acidilobus sp.]|uniref:AAA family ATPase n=1 Tax=Acidilobus sp. TaxID=1872109 RepID=UPI003D0789F6